VLLRHRPVRRRHAGQRGRALGGRVGAPACGPRDAPIQWWWRRWRWRGDVMALAAGPGAGYGPLDPLGPSVSAVGSQLAPALTPRR
jgi:hypothetical protein